MFFDSAGKVYASLFIPPAFIPRSGDEVRLSSGIFQIKRVVWLFENDCGKVNIQLGKRLKN